MFGILQAQAPAKQTATDTINVLSSRLLSATLLEDRRAAILGLRSFAKQYPASVASGALRGLISSLRKDAEDVDTVKVVLETLLMLFAPDENSPEASDDIALWLADEFTQRQDNITVLLDLLDTHDFYSRLYSLQLLSAILSARPERTQECVFTAPLGISRLVAILDDSRDAVRNEALLFLTALTPSSPELQKLVAFENAFERVFTLILSEGALTHGGIVVQDCLSLLANLLRFNVSNQSYFRETGCVARIARLLADAAKEQDTADGVAEWVRPQRDKNLWGTLAVLRLFLVRGGLGTQANQTAFWQSGVVLQVLQLAFKPALELSVRAEALSTCADLIRGNAMLQQGFAQLQVDSTFPSESKEHRANPQQSENSKVYVIDGLLELVLLASSNQEFDLRLAAAECIKAYFYLHAPIRQHFLRRAIEGMKDSHDEKTNILTVLLDDTDTTRIRDPYRVWLAAIIMLHLVYEDAETKGLTSDVVEGDAAQGEEVITCVQALTARLLAGLQRNDDDRIAVGYLMLLCSWLFEDPDAVNDFLGEGSAVQSLIQNIVQVNGDRILTQGLCCILLGIIYEFSTKDSPVPRATLHKIITSRMGRDIYIDKMTRLREHPLIRDFEVLPQRLLPDQPGGLADVFFDKTFVDFLKDNFSRLLRAIDRDPGLEIPVITNGIQKGISRELVDSLRTQVDDKNKALQKAESDILDLERRLGQEQADHRRAKETATMELNRIKSVNESLQRHHEQEVRSLQETHRLAIDQAERKHQVAIQDWEKRTQHKQQEMEEEISKLVDKHDQDTKIYKQSIKKLESGLAKASKDHVQDLQTAHEEYSEKLSSIEAQLKRAEKSLQEMEIRAKKAEGRVKSSELRAEKAEKVSAEKEDARVTVQNELDDLLMVLSDLEEKRSRDKELLKSLGQQISDDEEEAEEDNEDEDEEDGEENVETVNGDHSDDVD